MIRSSEEILVDIDTTLDQLICNASAFEQIAAASLYEEEIAALHKTQESLMARLVHMNDLLKTPIRSKNIEGKIAQFGRLSAQLARQMGKEIRSNRPTIRKNRKQVRVLKPR